MSQAPISQAVSQPTQALEQASVRQYCKSVRMPTVGANFATLAEQAVKENHSHIRYLEALLVSGVNYFYPLATTISPHQRQLQP